MKYLVLAVLGFSLLWTTVSQGGVYLQDAAWGLLGVGVAGCLCWGFQRGEELNPGGRWALWLVLALVGIVLLQVVPLPAGVVGVLSPKRLATMPGQAWLTVSQVPGKTVENLAQLLAYLGIFLMARELVWLFRRQLWVVVGPVIAIGTLQAALGLVQWWLQRAEGISPMATGSYNSRNSFAGLLEMTAPLAVWAAVWIFVKGQDGAVSRRESPMGSGLKASALLSMGAAMLIGTVISLSRMGFLAALSGLVATGVMAAGGRGGRRVWPLMVVLVGGVAAFVLMPTDEWIGRFAGLAQTEDVSQDTRVQIWKETLPAIRAYAVLGCGFGGFESCFYEFKKVAPDATADFAHNDYLQVMLELGLVGFGVGMFLVVRVMGRLWWVGRKGLGESWYMAVGCWGALVAVLLHSLVDFNMYFPANAMVAAWIMGCGEGLPTVAKWEIAWGRKAAEIVVDGDVVFET